MTPIVDDSYFKRSVEFLNKFKWVYEHKVTNLLVYDVLDSIPPAWLTHLSSLSYAELNKIYHLENNGELIPEGLSEFIKECHHLTLKLEDYQKQPLHPDSLCKGLTPKKHHEIIQFSSYINDIFSKKGITYIVDIGAGIGNLARVLHRLFGYSVLGIDSNDDFVKKAQKLSVRDSDKGLSFITHTVNSDHASFNAQLETVIPKDLPFGVIGLHTCSNLALDAVRFYESNPQASALSIIPCCYHKVNYSNISNYFPLSGALKKYLGEPYPLTFFRLASQDTRHRWETQSDEEHDQHAFNVLSRAVIELFAHQRRLSIKKVRRHCVAKSSREQGWNEFLQDFAERNVLIDEHGNQFEMQSYKEEINSLWFVHQHALRSVECFTGLQVCLQSVCESLIIADRVAYLLERGSSSVSLTKVLDGKISPRCVAFVLEKNAFCNK